MTFSRPSFSSWNASPLDSRLDKAAHRYGVARWHPQRYPKHPLLHSTVATLFPGTFRKPTDLDPSLIRTRLVVSLVKRFCIVLSRGTTGLLTAVRFLRQLQAVANEVQHFCELQQQQQRH